MKVYLEVAIIDNLTINCLILSLTGKLFKTEKNKALIFLSSLVGTIFALIFPLIKASNALLLLLKILLGICMVAIALKPKSVKDLIFKFLMFLAFTFLLCGLILAVYECFGIDVNNIVLMSSSSVFPVSIFVFFVFVFFKLSKKIITTFFSFSKILKNKLQVRIYEKNKAFNLSAIFDSGNLLVDEKTRLPVCVISGNAFKKIYSSISLTDLILKKETGLNDAHYIHFSTVSSGKSSMLVFKPQKLEILLGGKWQQREIAIGISISQFSAKTAFDLLLNAQFEV